MHASYNESCILPLFCLLVNCVLAYVLLCQSYEYRQNIQYINIGDCSSPLHTIKVDCCIISKQIPIQSAPHNIHCITFCPFVLVQDTTNVSVPTYPYPLPPPSGAAPANWQRNNTMYNMTLWPSWQCMQYDRRSRESNWCTTAGDYHNIYTTYQRQRIMYRRFLSSSLLPRALVPSIEV